jgi:hypothetical protein
METKVLLLLEGVIEIIARLVFSKKDLWSTFGTQSNGKYGAKLVPGQ